MAIPELLRPVLRSWWEQHGSPASGRVFPARRGKNAGGFKAKRGISYAKRLRKALFRAEIERHVCTRPAEAPPPKVSEACCEALGSDPIYSETAYTLPVDFHSFRRAYSSGLAQAGVNLQHAMIFAGHSDPRTHMRDVQRAPALQPVPEAALPDLRPGIATARAFSAEEMAKNLARHTGFEPVAFGFGGRYCFDSYRHCNMHLCTSRACSRACSL
jgi:integrase